MAGKPNFKMTTSDRQRLEREIKKNIQRDIVPQFERQKRSEVATTLNSMVAAYKGKPVAEVRAAVVEHLGRIGVTVTDPELGQYAQEIVDGGSFTV